MLSLLLEAEVVEYRRLIAAATMIASEKYTNPILNGVSKTVWIIGWAGRIFLKGDGINSPVFVSQKDCPKKPVRVSRVIIRYWSSVIPIPAKLSIKTFVWHWFQEKAQNTNFCERKFNSLLMKEQLPRRLSKIWKQWNGFRRAGSPELSWAGRNTLRTNHSLCEI